MLYVLVMTIFLGNSWQSFTVDTGLTLEDCAVALANNGNASNLTCEVSK